MLNFVMLSVIYAKCQAYCAECRFSECRGALQTNRLNSFVMSFVVRNFAE
jgi:hypothetical protein